MKAYGRMGMKIQTNELDHMIEMAFIPIYCKKFLLHNQFTHVLETKYVASGTRVLISLFK